MPMVEAAGAWQTSDPSAGRRPKFERPAGGCVASRGVNSLVVVIVDVLAQQSPEAVLADHDDVVEKLSANVA
jgi:hypothetical protein